MAERDPKTGRFPPRPNAAPKGGVGIGGPAKGAGVKITAETQPSPEAKSAGKAVAQEIRARIAAKRNEILEAQFTRALDVNHTHGHAAAKDLLDRILPPQQEISGADGAPLVIERRIVDPKVGGSDADR